MDSDSDNQSDSTEQMDESDDLNDLRVMRYPESADIIIRNFNRKPTYFLCNNFLRCNHILANPSRDPPPLPNNTVSSNIKFIHGISPVSTLHIPTDCIRAGKGI